MDKEWNDKKLNEYFDLTGDEIKFIDDHIKERNELINSPI